MLALRLWPRQAAVLLIRGPSPPRCRRLAASRRAAHSTHWRRLAVTGCSGAAGSAPGGSCVVIPSIGAVSPPFRSPDYSLSYGSPRLSGHRADDGSGHSAKRVLQARQASRRPAGSAPGEYGHGPGCSRPATRRPGTGRPLGAARGGGAGDERGHHRRLLAALPLHILGPRRPEEARRPAQLLASGSQVLGLGLLAARDTVWLRDWSFVPSTRELQVAKPESFTLTASQGGLGVSLTYRFHPTDYLIEVEGKLEGLGPNGATLLVGMGPGLRNTEADSLEHRREVGIVVKGDKAALTRFGKLKPGQPMAFDGPFEWVALKSKYFVTALLVLDSSGTGRNGGIAGASALAADPLNKSPALAQVTAGLPLPGAGAFRYQLYAGPLEYPRLRAIGHAFDDVNPYGWPGFRTIIRPVALGARSLLVWLHDRLGLAYGMGLVLFGIVIRLLPLPLHHKAQGSTNAQPGGE